MWEPSPIPARVDTSIGGVLSRTFKIYRKHFLATIVLIAIVNTPISFLNMALSRWQTQQLLALQPKLATVTPGSQVTPEEADQVFQALSQEFGIIAVEIGFLILTTYVSLILIYAPLTHLASAYYHGREASFGQAFDAVGKKLGKLLGGFTLLTAILIVMAVALAFVLFACGLGFGLLVFVGVAAGQFLIPTLMAEDKGITESLGRSWRLGKKRIWALIGISALVLLLTVLGSFIIGIVVGLFMGAGATSSIAQDSSTVQLASTVLGLIIGIFIGPILPIAYTLMYHDTRAKFEPQGTVMAAENRLLMNDDILNLAIVCVGTLVVLLVLFGILYAVSGSGALSGLGAFQPLPAHAVLRDRSSAGQHVRQLDQ